MDGRRPLCSPIRQARSIGTVLTKARAGAQLRPGQSRMPSTRHFEFAWKQTDMVVEMTNCRWRRFSGDRDRATCCVLLERDLGQDHEHEQEYR